MLRRSGAGLHSFVKAEKACLLSEAPSGSFRAFREGVRVKTLFLPLIAVLKAIQELKATNDNIPAMRDAIEELRAANDNLRTELESQRREIDELKQRRNGAAATP
jgi:hypothetical protein